MTKKIGFISLGCAKNLTDTETMLGILSKEGYTITSDEKEADVIVVNTCAFIDSAKEESIGAILEMAELKKEKCELLIVTGCLAQRYKDDIITELPEVDIILGTTDYALIADAIKAFYDKGKKLCFVSDENNLVSYDLPRVQSTPKYTAYLKIADGCDNFCTYCIIPKLRGKFRSRPVKSIIEEAKRLAKSGVKELILVAQDTAKYGLDLPEKTNLSELIRKITALDSVGAVRLMYCYPENLTDELIVEIKNNDKVIKYIDIPLQHADDKVLKLMNRKGTGAGYLELINKLKTEIPDIAIRSTFITGFPRESEQAFNNLVDFIKKAKLFNAGFFAYSREEGTPAYRLDGQIDEKIKQKRLKKLYSVQQKVVEETNEQFIGKVLTVTAEGFDQNEMVYFGRAYFNAPDIDGKVYFFSAEEVERGESYQVKITQITGYDLYGERL